MRKLCDSHCFLALVGLESGFVGVFLGMCRND